MGSLPILLGYLAIKACAYAGWCYVGLRAFRPEGKPRLAAVLGLGILRLLLGLVFGIGIFFASAFAYAGLSEGSGAALSATATAVLTYLATYVPVRWIEWALIELILTPAARSPGGFLLGSSSRSRLWRLGAISVSCLADVPMILALGGLPLGRFMC